MRDICRIAQISVYTPSDLAMMKIAKLTFLCGLATAIAPDTATAQDCCQPAYRVESKTVWVPQQETRYRIVYETVAEEKEVVSYRSVLKTRDEERVRTVRKPVTETSTVEERYTVSRPVKTIEYIDQSYDETTYVTETSEREQTYVTQRPVTETHYQTQNRVVQRPVVETTYQTQNYTTYKPVTTYNTAVVDQGQYVAQQYYQPGDTRYGLRWMPRSVDPYGAYRRGGLGWVPYTSPGQTSVQLSYRPNPVSVAVPQTSLMPEVQQVQVPVQVTRMQNEVIQEQIPVNVTRMEAVQEVRKIPVTVQRPVTRRVNKQVPVERTEWVEQEMVRPKTVTRTSYKLETIKEVVPVQYYDTEEVRTMVKVPRQVPVRQEYQVTVMVPRTVSSPVRLSYMDPYAVPLSAGHSSWMPSTGSTVVEYGPPRLADELPKQSVKRMDISDPDAEDASEATPEPPAEVEDPSPSGLLLEPATGDDSPRA